MDHQARQTWDKKSVQATPSITQHQLSPLSLGVRTQSSSHSQEESNLKITTCWERSCFGFTILYNIKSTLKINLSNRGISPVKLHCPPGRPLLPQREILLSSLHYNWRCKASTLILAQSETYGAAHTSRPAHLSTLLSSAERSPSNNLAPERVASTVFLNPFRHLWQIVSGYSVAD